MSSFRDLKWFLIRHGALLLVLVCSLTAVFFVFQGLIQQRELVEKESRINIWLLAQTEIEFIRFSESLKDFELDPGPDTAQEARDRFEIFWSRLPPLLEGKQTEDLRAIEGLVPITRGMIRKLTELEPEMQFLETLSAADLQAVETKLDRIRGPVHDLVRRALLFETEEVSQARDRHEELYQRLLALFALILAGSAAILVLLFLQIVKTNRAIGEKEKAAAEAIAARKELELAINSISEGFIIYDQDDRVELFNQRYVDLHPMQAEDLKVGVSFQDLLRSSVRNGGVVKAEDEIEDWIASIMEKRRAAVETTFESRIENGVWQRISERWTSDGRLVGVHTDITELKEREEVVQRQAELLQTTLDNMNHGIAVFDSEMQLTLFNHRYLEINGYPEELMESPRTYREMATFAARRGDMGPGDPDALVDQMEAGIRQLQRTPSGSWRHTRTLTDKRVVESIVTALPAGGFVKTYEDISERVASEAERTRLTEMYHSAQRTQALGTLAGGMAHDFNNIIGSIIANCSLLIAEAPRSKMDRDRLDQIVASGTRARDLVRQILTFSRNAGSNRRAVDLGYIVRDSLRSLQDELPNGVTLQLGNVDACTIDGDSTQIHQVIMNACVNAADAIGRNESGQISVSLQLVDIQGPDDPSITSYGDSLRQNARVVRGQTGRLERGRFARVSVTDTGTGIPEEIMPRIFEPFYTTKEVGEANGLGLAAVQGIMRNHDGAILVESLDGIGTRFDFYFPVLDAPALVVSKSPKSSRTSLGSERLLLVDDDRMLLSATRDVLMRLGYTVEAHAEPHLALESFKADPGVWDLVITDRSMPKMDGEEFAAAIKTIRPELPVLMLSGFVSAEEIDRLKEVGICNIVAKPVFPDELSAAVRNALGDGDERAHRVAELVD